MVSYCESRQPSVVGKARILRLRRLTSETWREEEVLWHDMLVFESCVLPPRVDGEHLRRKS